MTEFRVLGSLEVLEDGQPVAVPGRKPRALLAILLLDANRTVPADRLIDDLWEDDPPETAATSLQVHVSQLRRTLGAARIETRGRGYAVVVAEDELDAVRFERLVDRARAELAGGDAQQAVVTTDDALALWRGPALADFRNDRFAAEAAARLDELRVGALELRLEAQLALGHEAAAIPELERLAAEHPRRERLRELLMLALYRSGRQADALDVYRRTRTDLAEELGLEPGPALRELERRILDHDPALAPAGVATRANARPGPVREPPDPSRAAMTVAGAFVAAALAAAGIFALVDHGRERNDRELQTFTLKVENILRQSEVARNDVRNTIGDALECRLSPSAAVKRLNAIQENRQSLLQQLAALRVPPRDEAMRAADLLQRAMRESIEVDWGYRDWIGEHDDCARPPPPRALVRADFQAALAKVRFVKVFNPIATRFGERTWLPTKF